MTDTNPHASRLAAAAERLATARLGRTYALLHDAFVITAAAGAVDAASTLVDWMYGGDVPVPASSPIAFSTSAVDGFCAAAGLGDRARGLPQDCQIRPGSLQERVRAAEPRVRQLLLMDGYASGAAPVVDANWRSLPAPWRVINRWRWIQRLAATAELQAIAEIETYIADWQPDMRGAGSGAELILALDLAFRHGRSDLARTWIATQGHRFAKNELLLNEALCLPALAQAMVRGELRGAIGLEAGAIASALEAIERSLALAVAAAKAPAPPTPNVQKRRVDCSYSQFYLEHEGPPNDRPHFQDDRDFELRVSIRASSVGILTPTETAYVDIEVSRAEGAPVMRDDAIQGVAFPFEIRGPLYLRSADGAEEEDPVLVPYGRYDVVTCFYPAPEPGRAGRRVFRVEMFFLPAGTVGAPRCMRSEDGDVSPETRN